MVDLDSNPTKLIEIGHQSVETKTGATREGTGGTKPREVTLAEAIAKINQENQRKLFVQVAAIKEKVTAFEAGVSPASREALIVFEQKARQTCATYPERDDIDTLVADDFPDEWHDCQSALYDDVLEDNVVIMKEYLSLIQSREQLAKIESRFYMAQAKLRGDLEASGAEMSAIAVDLDSSNKVD